MPVAAGTLCVVGGAEDRVGERVVLREFVRLAGGDGARIAVVATASTLGPEILESYDEAFSREEFASGWWASTDPPGPAFYSYTYPEPDGLTASPIRPAEAFFDTRLDEFALTWDSVRASANPDAAALDFLQSTYEAGADRAGWDRALLEASDTPGRPPKRPWSIMR